MDGLLNEIREWDRWWTFYPFYEFGEIIEWNLVWFKLLTTNLK